MNSSTLAKAFISACAAFSLSAAIAQEADEAPAAAPAETRQNEKVILVLDGSGSMWGQIDGETKIEIARNVVSGLLDEWDASIELGVMAYGHREKGACDDIELLSEAAPVDRDAVMAKVNAINPKGKTPISASVRKAAEALKYTEDKATVILLSDGLETCDADPCALASELEEAGVDFTTHVVGFDVADEEQAGLACLAQNTGGKFFSAQNAGELTTALAETVEIVKQAPAEPGPEPEPAGPQGVMLEAKLCETCEKLTDNLYWRVYSGEKNLDGKREEIDRSGQANPLIELVAGDYHVQVKHGDAYETADFTIEPGKLNRISIVLNAGNLRVNAVATEGGEALDDNMYYRVYSAKTDLSGKREEVTRSGSAVPLFRLPAGDYVVQAKHGEAYAEAPATVAAGELTETTVDMNVGYLRAAAVMADGGEPLDDGLFYRVYEARTDLSGKRKEIDRNGGANPLFRLPAGDYVLHVKHGAATSETPVTVSAGSLTETTVVQNSGRVRVTATIEEGGAALNDGLFWRVYEAEAGLEGKRKEIDRSGGASPVFTLPAGDYVVTAKYGDDVKEAPLTLAAGEEKTLSVIVNP